ncbi:helix-turn-helix domain-containing protein [Roseovarius aquimarinus]|uniref:Helix-turn-helix domain-containing protein n=1 Tax=Roseovarius aquimarinus TaxID=1229156 RepID=A0ABW7I276_9RHOB
MSSELEKNLQFLCAEKPSVAQVCREIGINHQQFSKYLSGRSRPSAHNLRRISRYFGLPDTVLCGSHEALLKIYLKKTRSLTERRRDPLATAFPGDLAALRPHLGAYQVHFTSTAAPGSIFVNAVFLDEVEGTVRSRLIEVLPEAPGRPRRWTRCDGKVGYQNGRIFVIDNETTDNGSLTMTILVPPHRQNKRYLFGKTLFLASVPLRAPTSSDVVWKKVEAYQSVREIISSCGAFERNSRKLDPLVRGQLASE